MKHIVILLGGACIGAITHLAGYGWVNENLTLNPLGIVLNLILTLLWVFLISWIDKRF